MPVAQAPHLGAHHPDLGGLLGAPEAVSEALQPHVAVQAAGGQVELGPAVMQQPAQPVLDAGAFGDDVVAVIEGSVR
jgi:hypothetical protein